MSTLKYVKNRILNLVKDERGVPTPSAILSCVVSCQQFHTYSRVVVAQTYHWSLHAYLQLSFSHFIKVFTMPIGHPHSCSVLTVPMVQDGDPSTQLLLRFHCARCAKCSLIGTVSVQDGPSFLPLTSSPQHHPPPLVWNEASTKSIY